VKTALRLVPGTRVTHVETDWGTWIGTVVVCLCKRHKWQQQVGEGGPGRECGHAKCGFPRAASACPWPLHVRWDGHWSDVAGPNESHQGPESLKEIEEESE
jgi:hypothetical protein